MASKEDLLKVLGASTDKERCYVLAFLVHSNRLAVEQAIGAMQVHQSLLHFVDGVNGHGNGYRDFLPERDAVPPSVPPFLPPVPAADTGEVPDLLLVCGHKLDKRYRSNAIAQPGLTAYCRNCRQHVEVAELPRED
jgi:hypothetical protein